MQSTLDHKMIRRLCFGLILMVLVTASIKGWAFKKRALYLTPGIAHKFFVQSGLAEDLKLVKLKANQLPLDGWGHPFFWISDKRLLVSAGKDERFQSADDQYFGWVHSNCSPEARKWMLSHDFSKGWDFHSLPVGIQFKPLEFVLQTPSGNCPLPDLSGADGLSGTSDDARLVRLLEPGRIPQWRDVFQELKAKQDSDS